MTLGGCGKNASGWGSNAGCSQLSLRCCSAAANSKRSSHDSANCTCDAPAQHPVTFPHLERSTKVVLTMCQDITALPYITSPVQHGDQLSRRGRPGSSTLRPNPPSLCQGLDLRAWQGQQSACAPGQATMNQSAPRLRCPPQALPTALELPTQLHACSVLPHPDWQPG